jgi:hypothetical protein
MVNLNAQSLPVCTGNFNPMASRNAFSVPRPLMIGLVIAKVIRVSRGIIGPSFC